MDERPALNEADALASLVHAYAVTMRQAVEAFGFAGSHAMAECAKIRAETAEGLHESMTRMLSEYRESK